MTPRKLHSKAEAAELLSISERVLDRLVKEGLLETVTIGRRRLVPDDCLNDYVLRLREAS